jgi:hypothetical protein
LSQQVGQGLCAQNPTFQSIGKCHNRIKMSPEIGPKVRIKATRAAPVAIVALGLRQENVVRINAYNKERPHE